MINWRAGGYAGTIPELGGRMNHAAPVVVVIAQGLTEHEDCWLGPETEGRDLARLRPTTSQCRCSTRRTLRQRVPACDA